MEESSLSYGQLTPRSKLKALFADVQTDDSVGGQLNVAHDQSQHGQSPGAPAQSAYERIKVSLMKARPGTSSDLPKGSNNDEDGPSVAGAKGSDGSDTTKEHSADSDAHGNLQRTLFAEADSDQDERDHPDGPSTAYAKNSDESDTTKEHSAESDVHGNLQRTLFADADPDQDEGDHHDPTMKPGFQALVERKRAERQRERQQEHLSEPDKDTDIPAVGHSDDEGEDDRKGLTQRAAVGSGKREASKKAWENMRRETDRMERDMALAPKSHVVKNFSMDSFFSRIKKTNGQVSATNTSPDRVDSETRQAAELLTVPPLAFPQPLLELEDEQKDLSGEGSHSLPACADPNAAQTSDTTPHEPQNVHVERQTENTRVGVSSGPRTAVIREKTEFVELESDEEASDEARQTIKSVKHLQAWIDRKVGESRPGKRDVAHLLRAFQVCDSPSGLHVDHKLSKKDLDLQLRKAAAQKLKLERFRKFEEFKAAHGGMDAIEAKSKMLQDGETLFEKARQEAEAILRRERESHSRTDKSTWDDDGDSEYEGEVDGEGEDEQDDEADEEVEDAQGDEGGDSEDSRSDVADAEAEQSETNSDADSTSAESERVEPNGAARNIESGAGAIGNELDQSALQPQHSTEEEDIKQRTEGDPKVGEAEYLDQGATARNPSKAILASKTKTRRRRRVVSDDDGDEGQTTQNIATQPAPAADNDLSQFFEASMPILAHDEGKALEDLQKRRTTFNAFPDNLESDDEAPSESFEQAQRHIDVTDRQPSDTQLSVLSPDLIYQQSTEQGESQTQATEVDSTQLSILSHPEQARRLRRLVTKHKSKDALQMIMKSARKELRPEDMERLKNQFLEEQAEESEDEYAGLGGPSDDELEDDSARKELQAMIDDNKIDIDEEALASHFRERESARDQQYLMDLMKGIGNGTLKRGRGVGILDSDDEEEDGQRRLEARRKRQRELILENEQLGQLDNPKNHPFLKTIEDAEDMGKTAIHLNEPNPSYDSGIGSSPPATHPRVEGAPNTKRTNRDDSKTIQSILEDDQGVSQQNSDHLFPDDQDERQESDLRANLNRCIERTRPMRSASSAAGNPSGFQLHRFSNLLRQSSKHPNEMVPAKRSTNAVRKAPRTYNLGQKVSVITNQNAKGHARAQKRPNNGNQIKHEEAIRHTSFLRGLMR